MSKNIFISESYFAGYDKTIMTVAFGGQIQVGSADLKTGTKTLILADTETDHKIGDVIKKTDNWFDGVKGGVVSLAFTSPESIDVVIDELQRIKKQFNETKEVANG